MSTVTRNDIKKGLKQLGLKEGDLVLVHSSLSSFGHVEGGADAVVDALLETVGKKGTVAVPTSAFRGTMLAYVRDEPLFDVVNTPSLLGKITETLRRRKEALRSLEGSHSVAAIGPLAPHLIKEHEKAGTPCGWETPWGRLATYDGYILLIGVGFSSCTFLHAVEEIAGVYYCFMKETGRIHYIDEYGNKGVFDIKIHEPGHPRDYGKAEKLLRDNGLLREATVGNALLKMCRARDLLHLTMREVKKNPDFLLKKS